MTEPARPERRTQRRNRMMLLAIFAIFFGSLLLAGVLRFSGWRPAGTKAHGETAAAAGRPARAWCRSSPTAATIAGIRARALWRIALAPPADCIEACVKLAHDLDTVWQLTGKDADRVHVLWIGAPPPAMPRDAALRVLQSSAALRAGLPRVARARVQRPHGVPVYVIDPNGFVILRYAPGFDPGGPARGPGPAAEVDVT